MPPPNNRQNRLTTKIRPPVRRTVPKSAAVKIARRQKSVSAVIGKSRPNGGTVAAARLSKLPAPKIAPQSPEKSQSLPNRQKWLTTKIRLHRHRQPRPRAVKLPRRSSARFFSRPELSRPLGQTVSTTPPPKLSPRRWIVARPHIGELWRSPPRKLPAHDQHRRRHRKGKSGAAAKKERGGGNLRLRRRKKRKKKRKKMPLGSAAWRRWGVKLIHQARCISPPPLAPSRLRTHAENRLPLKIRLRLLRCCPAAAPIVRHAH